jgi:hypothetical protein
VSDVVRSGGRVQDQPIRRTEPPLPVYDAEANRLQLLLASVPAPTVPAPAAVHYSGCLVTACGGVQYEQYEQARPPRRMKVGAWTDRGRRLG